MIFLLSILCRRDPKELFYKKLCIGGRRCTKYGDLELFHRKFLIDTNQSVMLDVTITWKKYEYAMGNQPSSSTMAPRGTNYGRMRFLFHN